MKKKIALVLSILLVLSVAVLSGCGDKTEPKLTEEEMSEVNVKADYSGFSNYAESVRNISVLTAINNYSAGKDGIDDLLLKGRALKQQISDEKIKEADGLDAFNDAYKFVETLPGLAEKAAAKYVKGFYKAYGEKEITNIYCYMSIPADKEAKGGNSYLFALTYKDGEEEKNVFMSTSTANDALEVSVYEEYTEKFFSDRPVAKMMDTTVYHNITLDLAEVLKAAG